MCVELSLQEYRVSAVLNKRVQHYKHFIFVFETEYDSSREYHIEKYIKLTKAIQMYNMDNILIKEFNNMREASLFIDVCPSTIRKALIKSKTHRSKNYVWKFKN